MYLKAKKAYFYKNTDKRVRKRKTKMINCRFLTAEDTVLCSFPSNSSSFRNEKCMLFLQTYQNFSFFLRKISSILQSVSGLQIRISSILKQALVLLLSEDLTTLVRN